MGVFKKMIIMMMICVYIYIYIYIFDLKMLIKK
jgi:hypothetical protein